VLGMVLVKATGMSISVYMQKKLWRRIGTERDAYWVVDNDQMESAPGGLNATLRDYARVGRLYLNGGMLNVNYFFLPTTITFPVKASGFVAGP
jgi:CubicO group peptidase (beta-lactamase class C family)